MDVLLGVKFLASEYEFSDGRIDTLGIDENNSPVIVEYKKAKSSEVILPALFYKNWLLDHRADFELLCRNKLKESVKIDWSNPRVVVITQEFNKWDKFAVQQMGGKIELKTYKLYEDNRLYLEDLIMKEEKKREVESTDIEGCMHACINQFGISFNIFDVEPTHQRYSNHCRTIKAMQKLQGFIKFLLIIRNLWSTDLLVSFFVGGANRNVKLCGFLA